MFSMLISISLTVTSPFIRSVKAMSPNSTINTATIFNSRLRLNLNFILCPQHFLDRFNKRVYVSCTNGRQYFYIELLKFLHQVILAAADLDRTRNILKDHVGVYSGNG